MSNKKNLKSFFFYVLSFCSIAFAEQDISNLFLEPGSRKTAPHTINEEDYCCGNHWQFQVLPYIRNASEAFSCDCETSLNSLIFGSSTINFANIYLASNISQQGLLRLPGNPPLPGPFGNSSNQQYIGCLAADQLAIQAWEKEIGFDFNGLYYFEIPCTCGLLGALGFLLPIKQQTHNLDIDFSGVPINCGGPITTDPNNITQFFSDYSSIEDFFARAILEPKRLILKEQQQETNIGDLSICALVDVRNYISYAEALQLGINVIFPTAKVADGSIVWPLELGNGGGYHVELFVNSYFEINEHWFNPLIFLDVRFSSDFSRNLPVPQIKNQNSTIFFPPTFQQYIILPFSQIDTTITNFADQTICVTQDTGNSFYWRIANFFNSICNTPFDLGIFYDGFHKAQDNFSICNATNSDFVVSSLQRCTEKTVHKISWSFIYTDCPEDPMVQLYFGTRHVVAGACVPIWNEAFASLTVFF